MAKQVVAVVGSYRKDGTIDTVVKEVLSAAEACGAGTRTIHLRDAHIEFCRNCRACTQTEGPERGKCVQDDDMAEILTAIEGADALVLGAPVNFFNVNALFRQFMERLVGYAYWPWGKQGGPSMRPAKHRRPAVLVTSSAMPGFLVGLFTGAPRALRLAAKTLGAKPVATLAVGFAAVDEQQPVPERALRKARKAGERIAA